MGIVFFVILYFAQPLLITEDQNSIGPTRPTVADNTVKNVEELHVDKQSRNQQPLHRHPSRSIFTTQTLGYLSQGRIKLQDDNINADQESNAKIYSTELSIMNSQKLRDRARIHLEATQPKLITQNPIVIFYHAYHEDNSTFIDLHVESDNSQYAQLYLQACMTEYLKLRIEVSENSESFVISQEATPAMKMTQLGWVQKIFYSIIDGY